MRRYDELQVAIRSHYPNIDFINAANAEFYRAYIEEPPSYWLEYEDYMKREQTMSDFRSRN